MKFDFVTLTHSPERINVVSAKLGATKSEKWSDTDLGKAMKMGVAGGNFEVAASGDDIEGVLDNVDAGGTTDGFVFGGVACGTRGFRIRAKATGVVALGATVLADAQEAVGTANDHKVPAVKAGDPVLHKWRMIANETNPANNAIAGDIIVLELL